MLEILSEELLYKQGSFRKVKRWLRGKHPSLGILIPPHVGLSGDWETMVELSLVSPTIIVNVDDNPS